MTLLLGVQDISNFDYKAGKFHNGQVKQTRGRRKVLSPYNVQYISYSSFNVGFFFFLTFCFLNHQRKMRERSSSESSWVDKGERAESPVFYPKRPSNNWAKSFLSNDTISQIASKEPVVPSIKIKLHMPSMSKPHLSIKGQPGPDDKTL